MCRSRAGALRHHDHFQPARGWRPPTSQPDATLVTAGAPAASVAACIRWSECPRAGAGQGTTRCMRQPRAFARSSAGRARADRRRPSAPGSSSALPSAAAAKGRHAAPGHLLRSPPAAHTANSTASPARPQRYAPQPGARPSARGSRARSRNATHDIAPACGIRRPRHPSPPAQLTEPDHSTEADHGHGTRAVPPIRAAIWLSACPLSRA